MTIPLQTRRTAPFHRPFPEFPDADQLLAYGSLSFLYMRAAKYDHIAFQDIRLLIQPPIDLRQFRIIEVDAVPRAAITWAFLSDAVEARLVGGEMIAPMDWRSGPHMWIMEVIAPYPTGNLGAKAVKHLLENTPPQNRTVRFPRFARPGVLNHVTEYTRGSGGRWSSQRLRAEDLTHECKTQGR